MANTKKVGSSGRFGARYGRRLRAKVVSIERVQRGKHKCPYCKRLTAKRVAAGIWNCTKCNSKFTGKAYIVGE